MNNEGTTGFLQYPSDYPTRTGADPKKKDEQGKGKGSRRADPKEQEHTANKEDAGTARKTLGIRQREMPLRNKRKKKPESRQRRAAAKSAQRWKRAKQLPSTK